MCNLLLRTGHLLFEPRKKKSLSAVRLYQRSSVLRLTEAVAGGPGVNSHAQWLELIMNDKRTNLLPICSPSLLHLDMRPVYKVDDPCRRRNALRDLSHAFAVPRSYCWISRSRALLILAMSPSADRVPSSSPLGFMRRYVRLIRKRGSRS